MRNKYEIIKQVDTKLFDVPGGTPAPEVVAMLLKQAEIWEKMADEAMKKGNTYTADYVDFKVRYPLSVANQARKLALELILDHGMLPPIQD